MNTSNQTTLRALTRVICGKKKTFLFTLSSSAPVTALWRDPNSNPNFRRKLSIADDCDLFATGKGSENVLFLTSGLQISSEDNPNIKNSAHKPLPSIPSHKSIRFFGTKLSRGFLSGEYRRETELECFSYMCERLRQDWSTSTDWSGRLYEVGRSKICPKDVKR
eukprot:g56631.t1